MAPSLRPVTHVLFDMDGLLLDTEEHYSNAYQAVMDSTGCGKQYTFEFKVRHIMGRKPFECAKRMIEEYELPLTTEEFLDRLQVEQVKVFPLTTWMPGILKLIHHFYIVRNYQNHRFRKTN